MNEQELADTKSKINLAQMKLEGVKGSLKADKIDTKRLGEQTETYKALFSQMGTIKSQLESADTRCNNLMGYIDKVISSYSSADRKLAGSSGGCM